jgi:hypothetical protein
LKKKIKNNALFMAYEKRAVTFSGLFYPGDDVVDYLLCTNFGSSTERLKESDLVRDSANN